MVNIPSRSKLGKYWNLRKSTVFLNHGSFGACPKEILAYQRQLRDQLEEDPINFLDVKAKELWAESIEIFFPIFHFGWFKACLGLMLFLIFFLKKWAT